MSKNMHHGESEFGKIVRELSVSRINDGNPSMRCKKLKMHERPAIRYLWQQWV